MPSLGAWGASAVTVIAASLAFATVGVCYFLTFSDPDNPQLKPKKADGSDMTPVDIAPSAPHPPPPPLAGLLTDGAGWGCRRGVFIPCISFLGVAPVPRLAYQLGFGSTAALMMLSIKLSFAHIRPHLLRHGSGITPTELQNCVLRGYQAAVGVGMQGVFTLGPRINGACFLHWGGAAVFAGAAQAHATAALELYDRAIKSGVSPALSRPPVLVTTPLCPPAPIRILCPV